MQTEVELRGPDEALLDWVRQGTEEWLLEKGGVHPHVVIERAGMEHRSILPLEDHFMASDEAKEAFCAAFRRAAEEFQVERYAFVCEGWVANASPDDPQSHVRPSEREDRREVLIVMVSSREDEALGSIREILRDADGVVTGLGPEEHEPELQMGGRFVGLLRAEE
jgi:hypothetical protein